MAKSRGARSEDARIRMGSIKKQTPRLLERGRLVRNALFCFLLSILFALFTSGLIFIEKLTGLVTADYVFGTFSLSMVSMVVAILSASREMAISYTTVMEVEEAEFGHL